jgi:hypothetical protein
MTDANEMTASILLESLPYCLSSNGIFGKPGHATDVHFHWYATNQRQSLVKKFNFIALKAH